MKKLLCLIMCAIAGFVCASEQRVDLIEASAYIERVDYYGLCVKLEWTKSPTALAAIEVYALQLGRKGLYSAIDAILSRIQRDQSFFEFKERMGLSTSVREIEHAKKLLLVLRHEFASEQETLEYKAADEKVREISDELKDAAWQFIEPL